MLPITNHCANNKKKIGRTIALAHLAWLLQPIASAQTDAEILEAASACQRQPGLSERLACYDRVFPPLAESVDAVNSSAPREEQPAAVADPEPSLPAMAQIVEVEMPSLSTTRFRTADGRVFVRSNATTSFRWPETPFDVEVQSGPFGTLYLQFPERGPRIRVSLD